MTSIPRPSLLLALRLKSKSKSPLLSCCLFKRTVSNVAFTNTVLLLLPIQPQFLLLPVPYVQLTSLDYLPSANLPTCLLVCLSTCLLAYLPTHLYSSPLCTTCHTLLILLRGLHHHLRCRTACSRCTEGCCLLRWYVNMMKVMYLRYMGR